MEESSSSNHYFYPNRIGRAYLQALEGVLGTRGLQNALRLAKLASRIENLPPDNLALEFPFEDFAALHQAVDEMYGERASRGLTLRAGSAAFEQGLKDFGAVVGVTDRAFRLLPPALRLGAGLKAMARVFSQFSDQISRVEDHADHYLYVIERCPICWGRQADHPICHSAVGLLEAGIEWGTGQKHAVAEIACVAMGAPTCDFRIVKDPIC